MKDLTPCEICGSDSIAQVVEYDEVTGNPTKDFHCFCMDHISEGLKLYKHTFKYNRWE